MRKRKSKSVANQKEGMAKKVKSKMLNPFSLRVPSFRPLQNPITHSQADSEYKGETILISGSTSGI
jgi:hypothetical protein